MVRDVSEEERIDSPLGGRGKGGGGGRKKKEAISAGFAVSNRGSTADFPIARRSVFVPDELFAFFSLRFFSPLVSPVAPPWPTRYQIDLFVCFSRRFLF